MSTRVGTLQAPRAGGSILLAAFLASFVMLTIAVVAISFTATKGNRVRRRSSAATWSTRRASELSAGIVGGAEQTSVGGTAANTPSELNAQARLELGIKTHEFIGDKFVTNRIISDGLPASFYDRHQRR